MSYLNALLARARPAKAAPRQLRAESSLSWSAPTAESAERQARLYTQLSWIQIAVEIKANTVATTPINVYARTEGGREAVANHPLELRLDRPNPMASRFEFLRDTSAWLDATGECYWWRNRAGPDAPDDELWIKASTTMEPIPDGYGALRGFWYDAGDGGERIFLNPWEVVYFKTFNPHDPYRGLSAIQALALSVQADVAAQRYSLSFYDRDNAKPQGILAFADNIPDDAWRRLDADLKDQTGGAKQRRMMKLRNVGPGGVQWIMTHVSQADMQLLEGRTFTKEEIFARVAPGLSSILAVNATEANAEAGMNTFLGMAVFPRCVAVAQKITNTMLESPDVAEFDDVRRADTLTELKQREAYERTHTVDEVRAKYDGDPPIGDERGDLLVSQAQSYKAPGETPPQLQPFVGGDPMIAAGKALDRRRWRDKALKSVAAGRGADVPFAPEYLDDDEAMEIRAALRRAQSAGDVGEALEGR